MANKIIRLRVLVTEDDIAALKEIARRRSVGESKWTWRELAHCWASTGISDRVVEEKARQRRREREACHGS